MLACTNSEMEHLCLILDCRGCVTLHYTAGFHSKQTQRNLYSPLWLHLTCSTIARMHNYSNELSDIQNHQDTQQFHNLINYFSPYVCLPLWHPSDINHDSVFHHVESSRCIEV